LSDYSKLHWPDASTAFCIPAPKKRYHVPWVMKEQDVRQRIESFLKRIARKMTIPASVGLSLGLTITNEGSAA
jgi:hypothetical protein